MNEFGERYSRPSLLDMMLPPSIPSPNDFGRRRFQQRWMNFIETILRSRLSEPQPATPRDLFDLLRAARDPETGAAFTPPQLRDQVATLILAGHETTGVTLFWALLMLAEAQDEQDWLAEETAEVTISPSAIPSLIRTKAVVNEALRLFPPAFVIVRETIKRDRAGSIDLPPRAVVMIAPWILHRHHKLWDDPAAFRPLRFMPDQPPPDRFAFMPFGAGPRICVGAQFAMAEAILVLAAITRRFRVTRVDTTPVLPVAVVTTQPDHHAMVRLKPR
jgi:cytochrome P450